MGDPDFRTAPELGEEEASIIRLEVVRNLEFFLVFVHVGKSSAGFCVEPCFARWWLRVAFVLSLPVQQPRSLGKSQSGIARSSCL